MFWMYNKCCKVSQYISRLSSSNKVFKMSVPLCFSYSVSNVWKLNIIATPFYHTKSKSNTYHYLQRSHSWEYSFSCHKLEWMLLSSVQINLIYTPTMITSTFKSRTVTPNNERTRHIETSSNGDHATSSTRGSENQRHLMPTSAVTTTYMKWLRCSLRFAMIFITERSFHLKHN
jgi:hypothetical protein